MQDVRVYDHWGNLLLIVPQYVHLYWEETFRAPGRVELTVTAPHKLYDLLEQSPYLLLKWNNNFAAVTGVSCKDNRITVHAKTLLDLLKRRVVPQDTLTLSGSVTALVTELIQTYAPFLQIRPGTQNANLQSTTLEGPVTLLEAIQACLYGSGLGMRIAFDEGVFYFEFVEKQDTGKRLSAWSRYAPACSVSTSFDAVQNAGYCIEYFQPPIELADTGAIGDMKPENYMKQYYLLYDIILNGIGYASKTYLYCDTPDGKFKNADSPQVSRLRYVALTENPLAVFETDLRHLQPADAENLLALRQYAATDWSANSVTASLKIGDVVKVEKPFGEARGTQSVQVRRTVFDSACGMPAVSFTQIEA